MNSVVIPEGAAALMMSPQRRRSWVPGTRPGMTIEE